MDDSAALKPEPRRLSSALRRRNSIATSVVIPKDLILPTTTTTTKPLQSSNSFPKQNGIVPTALDLEVISSLKSSQAYTSLKDLLPSSAGNIGSPTAASAANSGYEISIRNRLVKQAAWAYLQPMSSSPGSSGPHFLRRLWLRLSTATTGLSCFIKHHFIPAITRLLDRILRAMRLWITTTR